jgi:hypothetical protein
MRGDASQTDVYKRAYRGLANTLGPALELGLNFIAMKLKGLKYGGVDTEGHYWVDRNGVKYHEADLPKKGERASGGDEGDDDNSPYMPIGDSYGGNYNGSGSWGGAISDSVLDNSAVLNTDGITTGAGWRNLAQQFGGGGGGFGGGRFPNVPPDERIPQHEWNPHREVILPPGTQPPPGRYYMQTDYRDGGGGSSSGGGASNNQGPTPGYDGHSHYVWNGISVSIEGDPVTVKGSKSGSSGSSSGGSNSGGSGYQYNGPRGGGGNNQSPEPSHSYGVTPTYNGRRRVVLPDVVIKGKRVQPRGKWTVRKWVGLDGGTEVSQNPDGTFTVVDVKLKSGDRDIHIVDENGERTGKKLGETLTEYSFVDAENKPVLGAVIDPNDLSGEEFFRDEIVDPEIDLVDYLANAKGEERLDFKTRGQDEFLRKQHNLGRTPKGKTKIKERIKVLFHYRGMPFGGTPDVRTFATARDIGNAAAGYVAAVKGIPWEAATAAFDGLETLQHVGSELNKFKRDKYLRRLRKSVTLLKFEPLVTRRAQKKGYDLGIPIWKERQMRTQRQYIRFPPYYLPRTYP